MPPSDNGKWTCIPTVLFQSADHSKRLTTLVTSTHSLTHWRHRLPWGSVSCSAMLWQLGVLDSKQPPSYYWMTCSTSWATTANCTERTFHTLYSKPQAERGPLENAAHFSHTGPFHTVFSRQEYWAFTPPRHPCEGYRGGMAGQCHSASDPPSEVVRGEAMSVWMDKLEAWDRNVMFLCRSRSDK